MADWTEPTFSTGQVVRNADVTALLDNLQYLKSRNEGDTIDFDRTASTVSTIISSAGEYVTIDDECFGTEITLNGGTLIVHCSLYIQSTGTGSPDLYLSLFIDDVQWDTSIGANADYIQEAIASLPIDHDDAFWVVEGLSPGDHFIEIKAKKSGTDNVYVDTARRIYMWAIEVLG